MEEEVLGMIDHFHHSLVTGISMMTIEIEIKEIIILNSGAINSKGNKILEIEAITPPKNSHIKFSKMMTSIDLLRTFIIKKIQSLSQNITKPQVIKAILEKISKRMKHKDPKTKIECSLKTLATILVIQITLVILSKEIKVVCILRIIILIKILARQTLWVKLLSTLEMTNRLT